MSSDDIFIKQEEKKTTTISLTKDTLERLNEYVKMKKKDGFKVNKSALIEKSINNLLNQLEQEEKGFFRGA